MDENNNSVNKILEDAALNIVLVDENLTDKESLTKILLSFEQIEKKISCENIKDERILEIISKFISLFKSFILEEVEDIELGLKTANDGITLLKDVIISESNGNKVESTIIEIIKNLNFLLNIETDRKEEEKKIGQEQNTNRDNKNLTEINKKDSSQESDKKNCDCIEETIKDVHNCNELIIEDEDNLDIYPGFISESVEHLDSIESGILELENNPRDIDVINGIFRAFHSMKGASGFLGLIEIQDFCHEVETLLDKSRKKQLFITPDITDILFKSLDAARTMIVNLAIRVENTALPENERNSLKQINTITLKKDIQSIIKGEKEFDSSDMLGEIEKNDRIGDILLKKGKVSKEELDQALEMQGKPLGELLVDMGATTRSDVDNAVEHQKLKGKLITPQVKIDTSKLDLLLEMIGEMVIAQSQISQDRSINSNGNQFLLKKISSMDKITKSIQEHIMSLRMVPLKELFQKMNRLVRDVSRQTGKEVNFVVTGEETEIDKTIIDKLNDPLVHLLRNSVDHGIECKEDRMKAEKPLKGTIKLKACHKEGNVIIEVTDDGKGILKEKVRQKAINKCLIKEDSVLTDKEIFNLIFQPGFSTHEKATSISGRGVGMDVVKKNIEALSGKIEITSEEGKGTSMILKLPLTMAILDGMIVKLGSEKYIIPTISIKETIHPEESQITTIEGKGKVLKVRGQFMSLLNPGHIFDIKMQNQRVEESLIIVLENEGRKKGLIIDEIIGQQQVVIKSLGKSLKNISGISGGAILGNGNVSLILDVAGIMNIAGNN